MLITSKYNNMETTNETVTNIPKLRAGQYLLLIVFPYPLLFLSVTNFTEMKKNFALTKKLKR